MRKLTLRCDTLVVPAWIGAAHGQSLSTINGAVWDSSGALAGRAKNPPKQRKTQFLTRR